MRWARLIAQTFEHGHRAVCGGDLVGDLLDDIVIELEAVVEVVQEARGTLALLPRPPKYKSQSVFT